MNQPQQDFSARRFSTDNFDTELPPNARAEFFRPKRRGIAPPSPPQKRSWSNSGRLTAIVAFAFALVLVAIVTRNQTPASVSTIETPRVATTETRPPAPAPTPIPPAVEAPPAPRAQLIPTPVKRAILYRLPSQELGVYKWYELPKEWGGGSVWARYLGTKEHFSQIPRGPVVGDLWNVTAPSASWIYCIPQDIRTRSGLIRDAPQRQTRTS